MRRAFFVRRFRRFRRLRMRRSKDAPDHRGPSRHCLSERKSAQSAQFADKNCIGNRGSTLAKVVRGFSPSDAAGTGRDQACEQGAFAKGAVAKPSECGSLLPLFQASLLAVSLLGFKSRMGEVCAKRLGLSVEGRPAYSSPAGWLGKATAGCSTPKPVGTPSRGLWRGVFAKWGGLLFAGGSTAKAADYFRKRRCHIRLQAKASQDIRRLNRGSQSGPPDLFDHLSRHKLAIFSHQTPVFS